MSATPDPLPIDAFLNELKGIRDDAIQRIRRGEFGVPSFLAPQTTEARKRPEVIFYLQLGVYPEWREVHILGRHIRNIDDADLSVRIGKQLYEEAKHTQVLRDQLKKWGADPDRFWHEPLLQWSGSFDYMDRLTNPIEYFAASNFIGEGLFLPTIMRPMAEHDKETFAVYVEHIMPDEPSHIAIGRDIIAKFCTTHEIQERVRRAAATTAKLYCIGYEAAVKFAARAAAGDDPATLRDGPLVLPDAATSRW